MSIPLLRHPRTESASLATNKKIITWQCGLLDAVDAALADVALD